MSASSRYNSFAKCRKCDGVEISTIYHEAGCKSCDRCHDAYECKGGSLPHMVRHCQRCHFEWFEEPLDVQPQAPNSGITTYVTTAGSPNRMPSL